MQAVHEGDQSGWRQYDQEDVRQEEVRRPQGHLHNLDNEFSSRLRHGRGTQATAIPFTSPPSTIGLVMFEFTSKEDGDKEFLNGALNGDDSNDTKHGMGSVP